METVEKLNLDVSEKAISHFARMVKDQDGCIGIKFFVINGGSSNAELGIEYQYPDDIEEGAVKESLDGLDLYIRADSTFYLQDAIIDFVKEGTESHLSVKAPNLKPEFSFDGCRDLKEKVEKFFNYEINNALAEHGGMVELLDVQGSDIYIKFNGGCQGCSMVGVTLKNGIEKRIREVLPEIGSIIDATNHDDGNDPYYN